MTGASNKEIKERQADVVRHQDGYPTSSEEGLYPLQIAPAHNRHPSSNLRQPLLSLVISFPPCIFPFHQFPQLLLPTISLIDPPLLIRPFECQQFGNAACIQRGAFGDQDVVRRGDGDGGGVEEGSGEEEEEEGCGECC